MTARLGMLLRAFGLGLDQQINSTIRQLYPWVRKRFTSSKSLPISV